MNRFPFLAALLFASPMVAAEKPNILLILADDMGYGDLGCTGSQVLATPNIDRMRESGVLACAVEGAGTRG